MNINQLFAQNFKQSLMITCFVMVMMLIIEFINVFTKGRFSYRFQKNPILQIIMATFLGAIPGCLGTYAVVSLFTHHVIGFGALTAAFISTSGDEAFLMLSMFPVKAVKLFAILIIIAIGSGLIINFFEKRRKKDADSSPGFSVHGESKSECLSVNRFDIFQNLKNISFQRAFLIVALVIFILGVSLGEFANFHGEIEIPGIHNHEHDDHTSWVKITFLILSSVALIITLLATNHFLEQHLWNHIIRVHFLRIFLWTFGTLFIISFLAQFINMGQWIENNKLAILVFAVLVGLIPASGPHIVFITLFFSGSIPFSILLANSIVQDGHGALPLFAESKRNFILVKLINLGIGFFIGSIALLSGF